VQEAPQVQQVQQVQQIQQVQQVQQAPQIYPVSQQIQQSMQFPGQINMVQPGVTVQVPPAQQGVYGGRQMQQRMNMNLPNPSTNHLPVFNDDEAFQESVK